MLYTVFRPVSRYAATDTQPHLLTQNSRVPFPTKTYHSRTL